jgi:hypothetical protein
MFGGPQQQAPETPACQVDIYAKFSPAITA